MTAIIPGRKISALGGAASAIEKQFEHIVKVFRAIESIHRWGTLNFWLDFPLRIINPDFTTELIEWSPGQLERFSLTEIRLQLVKNNSQVPAWIGYMWRTDHLIAVMLL